MQPTEPKILLQKKSMSHELVELIKQKILSGELNPSERIVEIKLAKEFGISQSPVREAIRHLSGEGIVTIVPSKGPIVKKMEAADIFEIYSLRSSLEALAIHLTTQHASDEEIRELVEFYSMMGDWLHDDSKPTLLKESLHLHQSIIRLSRHSRLIQVYESISFQIQLVNRILGMTSTKQKEYNDHRELIDALVSRDPVSSEQIMRKHIQRSYQECMEVLRKNEASERRELWSGWFSEDPE